MDRGRRHRRLALPAAPVPHRQHGARPCCRRSARPSRRSFSEAASELRRAAHKTIAGVSTDIEAFHFNKAVARLYELANTIDRPKPKDEATKWALREALEIFVRLAGPMTPHLAEELWQALGHKSLLADAPWPLAEDALLVDDTVTMAVQLNGKLRGTLQLAKDAAKDAAETGGARAARDRSRARRQGAEAGNRGAEQDRERGGVNHVEARTKAGGRPWHANRTINSNAASAIGSRPSRSPRRPRPRRKPANARRLENAGEAPAADAEPDPEKT